MEALAAGERWDREYRIATPGASAWIHAIGRIDRDADGNAIHMSGIILDVTERRRTEDRLRRLQRATVEMAAAVGPDDVVAIAMAAARDLVDADAVGFGLVDDDGRISLGVLDPRTRRPVRTSFAPQSRALPGPASMLDRRPLRCPSLAARRAAYPATDELDTGFAYEAGAWAPIVAEDEALGFLSVHHRVPTDLTPDELALVEAAAQMCSQALVRARSHEREAAARDAAEMAAERLALLADVTEALEQEQEFSARLQRLLETLVPRIADFATVEALRADRRLELLALHHVEPEKLESLRRLREGHALDADAPVGMGHVIRTGRSLLLSEIPDELADDLEDPGRRLLRDVATRSFLAVPLSTHEGTVGALMLCTSVSGRVYTERDRELAEELADRIALVLENARLFDEQRRIARTLQLGLLGGAGTGHADITLALRYLPGTGAAEIGGDWYDAFDRDDGTLVIAVGDVVGRGLRAATTMAKLRNALRAFALVRDGPGEILHELDRFAQTVEGGVMTTVACAIVTPATGLCRVAAAGHPPPILVHPDGRTEAVMGGRSMPLIGDDGPRPEVELELPPGTTLALYSDGVIERRRETIDEGIGRLAQLAGDRFKHPVGVMADELLQAMVTSDVDDDAALLLLRRESPTSPVLFRRVSADPSQLAPLRVSLRSWFARARIDDADARDLLLACVEACNNAIEHAYTALGSGELCIEARLIGSEAHISVRDFGHWRPPAVAGDRGRGSMLMTALCDDVEVMRMRTGTMVTLRRRVSTRVPA
jgi:serine/threonine-protein kinase RsbW